MKNLLAVAMLALAGCASAAQPVAASTAATVTKATRGVTKVPETVRAADEAPPVSRAIADAQEAQLQAQLAPFRAKVLEGRMLPIEATFTSFPPRVVKGVRANVANDWVESTGEDLHRRLDSLEWKEDPQMKDVAAFVQSQVDSRTRNNQMPIQEGGLVAPEAVQSYVNDILSILDQAKSSASRITITVITAPKGATFELCREFVPTDCTSVGTNVTLADIFRGRYIYKITLKGYQKVQAPLNLVNFTQSRLWCPLHADSDSAGAVPCTPQ